MHCTNCDNKTTIEPIVPYLSTRAFMAVYVGYSTFEFILDTRTRLNVISRRGNSLLVSSWLHLRGRCDKRFLKLPSSHPANILR